MWQGAKTRAEAKGLPFTIAPEDIIVPTFCPVLGVELTAGGLSREDSPTLDRIVPARGYVPGNIIVVSGRANRLKGDASIPELIRIASFYQQLQGSPGCPSPVPTPSSKPTLVTSTPAAVLSAGS